MGTFRDWVNERVKEELENYDELSVDDRVISIAVIMLFPLIFFYFLVHQTTSSGFFTET